MQNLRTVNTLILPFPTDDLAPEKHSLLLQQLNQELGFYKFSVEQELQRNIHLLQRKSELSNSCIVKEQENGQVLRNMSTNTEQNMVKSEEMSDSNQELNNESYRRNKKQRRKTREKIDENDINETKNIPKNFGKAILSFIQRNIGRYKDLINPILAEGNLGITDLLLYIKQHKRQVNSINYLKAIWGYEDEENPICKCVRILSFTFLRRHCLSYVFNSRVKNHTTHIKYRSRIIQGLLNPEDFTCIKN